MTPARRFGPGRVVWGGTWLLLSALAAAGLIVQERERLRLAFDTEGRIAHRLLSQRAAQHDTILATLGLLQPGGEGRHAAERLPAVYPQVLAVWRRGPQEAWRDARFAPAEAESRRLGRAVLVPDASPSATSSTATATATSTAADMSAGAPEWAQGRYVLVAAGEPAGHALQLDVRAAVPWPEWPWVAGRPVQAALRWPADAGLAGAAAVAGAEVVLRPGRGPADGVATTAATDPARPLWRFEFRKPLASPSQPFELVAQRQVGWGELPWGRVAGVALALGALLGALAAWRAQAQARRRAEELLRLGQLARLNTLGELAAGMAHELNQPLTAVLAATQAARRLLDDDPPELDESRAAMQHAVAQAGRASAVVGRLRRLVERPDAGPASQSLVLAEVVREALDLLEPECRRRAVLPRLQLGAGTSPAVRADPVALQQIVHNLVMNALQALERVPAAERSLLLQIRTDGADAVLGVTDSGPGIPPEALPRVFEPFFTTREGGLGLGLSLSETLALGLGGSLAAASASSPRGATFTLRLPLA